MSQLRTISMLVVLVAIVHQSSSVPQPSISFQRLGEQKDNLLASIGGFKKELLAPVFGIKKVKLTTNHFVCPIFFCMTTQINNEGPSSIHWKYKTITTFIIIRVILMEDHIP